MKCQSCHLIAAQVAIAATLNWPCWQEPQKEGSSTPGANRRGNQLVADLLLNEGASSIK